VARRDRRLNLAAAVHLLLTSEALDSLGAAVPRGQGTKETRMEEQPTCGKGLASHAVLPARLAELVASQTENLEVHMRALDLEDQNARKEHEAYKRLATGHREIAAQLHAVADEMAGYRDLPMGRHDAKAMSDPAVLEAFEKFVAIKQELLALLQEMAEQDQRMLVAMRAAGAGGP
jgi:hypothetical protein